MSWELNVPYVMVHTGLCKQLHLCAYTAYIFPRSEGEILNHNDRTVLLTWCIKSGWCALFQSMLLLYHDKFH
jgi:hypothetical protein